MYELLILNLILPFVMILVIVMIVAYLKIEAKYRK